MFKPLLRTMPSLSGNMKIVCVLSNYKEIDEHVFEANVRTAQLKPLSSQLFNKHLNISLLNSSYEWDVKSFYKKYSDYFYKSLFDYNKEDLSIYEENGINVNRNTDFEYGCKRISYQKSFKQFGFFAPIYIESEKDIPDYFEINIDITNSIYKASRTIRVNVMNNLDGGPNYLGRYLYDYAKKIDDNVIYCNKDKYEGVYYGIDVVKGGFGIKHDTRFQSIFTNQNSILNFDNIISKGFERNKLIMKQIIPLSFYFSVNDILSEIEKTIFYGAELKIDGKWIKDGMEYPMHDFDINYTSYKPSIKMLNNENGGMIWQIPTHKDSNGIISDMNILNMGYPSMRESLYYKYRFTNKISPTFSRWKLKYSSDKHPYVTNMSPAFSFYQNSKTKYGNFPNLYETVCGIVTKKPYYLNLYLPLNGGESRYPETTVTKYKNIRNKFASDWFEVFEDIKSALNKCEPVSDNKVYFNGILYNLQTINDSRPTNKQIPNIDKFGVFIRPIFHYISDDQIRTENIYSTFTIFKEGSKYVTNNGANCHVNDNVLTDENPVIFGNINTSVKRDMLSMNNIFLSNKDDDGDFISLNKYGVDWWEANSFIRLEDIESKIDNDIYKELKSKSTDGYQILPIYKLSNVLNENSYISKEYSSDVDILYISTNNNSKIPLTENMDFNGVDYDNRKVTYDKTFYRKGSFIARENAENAIKMAYTSYVSEHFKAMLNIDQIDMVEKLSNNMISSVINKQTSYQFNPILSNTNGDVYAKRVFTSETGVSPRFYGDDIKTLNNHITGRNFYNKGAMSISYYTTDKPIPEKNVYPFALDNKFIYVDKWRLNTLIHKYNTRKDRTKPISYILDPKLSRSGFSGIQYYAENDKNGNIYNFDIFSEYNELNYPIPEHVDLFVHILDNFVATGFVTRRIKDTYYYFPNVQICTTEDRRNVMTFEVDSLGNEKLEFTSKVAMENWIASNQAELRPGKKYPYYLISLLCSIMCGLSNQQQFILNPNSEGTKNICASIQTLFTTLGLRGYGKKLSTTPVFALTEYNTLNYATTHQFDVPIKFLNLTHVKWHFKHLHCSVVDCVLNHAGNALSRVKQNVFIRKRVIDENCNVFDRCIPLYNLINLDYNDALNDVIQSLRYDDENGLFYFKQLKYKDGYIYKLNSDYFNEDNRIISQDLLWDISEYVSEPDGNGFIDGRKFQFELVFFKPMVRVNEDIWQLINLEQNNSDIYKDLYLYELEEDSEYNPNLTIQPTKKLYIGGESELEDSNISGVIDLPATAGLKPMFNLVTIETKDESRVYTEYSINNITKSTFTNEFQFRYVEQEITGYDENNQPIITENVLNDCKQYFYRHNCNNEIAMFDLSTINRSIPVTIKGKKYVYKSSFPDCHDPKYSEMECYTYQYFHDTYDLFGKNSVEFVNYSDMTYDYIPVGTYTYNDEHIVPIIGTYNTYAFSYYYPATYIKGLSYMDYGDNKIFENRRVGYTYDDWNHPEKSYTYYDPQDGEMFIIKRNNPTRQTNYIVTTYTKIETEEIREKWDYSYTYSYYNDLNIYDDHYLSTYEYYDKQGNKTTYGFYLIDCNINNTINSFNVVSYSGEYLKYVSYINGMNVDKNPDVVGSLYKQLVPFIKNNPLRYFMTNAYTIMTPSVFEIPLNYHPSAIYNKSGVLSYYDVLYDKGKWGNLICERYFDSIVPIINETSIVSTYNMKYKNSKRHFNVSYFTDEVMYKYDNSINYYPGVRVYNMNNQSEYEIKNDMEYKHFNSNKLMNLEESFSYIYEDTLNKSEVAIAQSNTRVFSVFKDHFINHTNSKLDDNGIEWAFSKYKVEFACEPVKLDSTLSEKLYNLEIKFELY